MHILKYISFFLLGQANTNHILQFPRVIQWADSLEYEPEVVSDSISSPDNSKDIKGGKKDKKYQKENFIRSTVTGSPKDRLERLQELLILCKDYLSFAEATGDVHLRRDALKRLVNCYSDISQVPNPETSADAIGTGDVVSECNAKYTSEGLLIPPEQQNFGTEREFKVFGAKEIEDYEKRDIIWLRRFSRLRAASYFKLMSRIELPPLQFNKDFNVELL